MLKNMRFAYVGVLMILAFGFGSTKTTFAARAAVPSALSLSGAKAEAKPAETVAEKPAEKAKDVAKHAEPAVKADEPAPKDDASEREADALVFPKNFEKLSELLKAESPSLGVVEDLGLFDQDSWETDVVHHVLDKKTAQDLDKRMTTLREYIASLKDCEGGPYAKKLAKYLTENFFNQIFHALNDPKRVANESFLVETVVKLEDVLKAYEKAHPGTKLGERNKKLTEDLKGILKDIYGDFRSAKLPKLLERLKADPDFKADKVEEDAKELTNAVAKSKEDGDAVCPAADKSEPGARKNRVKGETEDEADRAEDRVTREKDKLPTSPLPPTVDRRDTVQPPVDPTKPIVEPKPPVKQDPNLAYMQAILDQFRQQIQQGQAEDEKKAAERRKELRDTIQAAKDLKKAQAEAQAKAEKEKSDADKKKADDLDKLAQLDKDKRQQPLAPQPSAPPAGGGGGDSGGDEPRKLPPPPQQQPPQDPNAMRGPQPPMGGGGASPSSDAPTPSSEGENRFANAAGDGTGGSLVAPLMQSMLNPNAGIGGNSAVRDLDDTLLKTRMSGGFGGGASGGRPNANMSLAGQAAMGGAPTANGFSPRSFASGGLPSPASNLAAGGLGAGPAGARSAPPSSLLNMARGLRR